MGNNLSAIDFTKNNGEKERGVDSNLIFNDKVLSIKGIKSGKWKKLQITHSIENVLQHEYTNE